MIRSSPRRARARFAFTFTFLLLAISVPGLTPQAQSRAQPPKQKIDEEYTAKIKEYLQDPRITTELVDHLPASATVPTPLSSSAASSARRAS